ncbi:MAG: aromatic aminobenezylarsenical efflux permease ArsG family transporter [Deltaproteobacteria bacterium]|jgi:cytochrome c biogenesis protein CcdA
MEGHIIPVSSAIWFGILTSVSPCPLATNIAATSYIGKQIRGSFGTLVAGFSYTIGRAVAYICISMFIVSGLLSMPKISFFLQDHMNQILGPLLIISGLFILEVVSIPFRGLNVGQRFQKRLGSGGISGACVLGFIFALSFCPTSAALFFGSVIPLSLKYESKLLLPFLYGVGTAIPVLFVAAVLSNASRFAGVLFNRLSVVELWLRRATGFLFITIGIWFTVRYIFGMISF